MRFPGFILRYKYLLEVVGILFVILTGVLFFGGFIPKIIFVSETVHLNVDKEYLNAEVKFRYKNRFPIPLTQGFSIPTPRDEGLQEPQYIMVGELRESSESPGNLLPVSYLGGLPRFQARFGPREEKTIQVHYSQKHDRKKVKYLLTTTRKWRRPLESGRYVLTLDSVEMIHSNYPLERLDDASFAFERQNFMPSEDWIIMIQVPQ